MGITLRRQEDFELKPSGGGNWTLAIVVAKDISSVTLQPNHTGQPNSGSTHCTYEAARYLWSKSPGSHNRDDSTPGNVSVYARQRAAASKYVRRRNRTAQAAAGCRAGGHGGPGGSWAEGAVSGTSPLLKLTPHSLRCGGALVSNFAVPTFARSCDPYVRAHFASPWPLLALRRQEEAQRAHIMGQILDPASGKGPPLKFEMHDTHAAKAQSRQDRSMLAGVAGCCKSMLAALIWQCRCCKFLCCHFICCCFKDCVRSKHVPFYLQPGQYILEGAARPSGWREGYKVVIDLKDDGSVQGTSTYTWYHDGSDRQTVDNPERLKLDHGRWENVTPSDTEPGGGKITYFEHKKEETKGRVYELTCRDATSLRIGLASENGRPGAQEKLKLHKENKTALLAAC